MNWQTIVVVACLLLSAALAINLAVFAWHRRSLGWTLPFALTTAALAEWSLFYALEIIWPQVETKVLWGKLEYIGITLIPVGWFTFAQAYSGREEWLSPRRFFPLLIIPVITMVSVFTNELHHLHWATVAFNSNGPFTVMDATYGPGWWLNCIYDYGLLLWGSIVLFRALHNLYTAYRWRLIILLLSPVLPWVANILYIVRISPIPQLDLSPFAFTISALILGVGILRFHMFDLAPVVRSSVIENMSVAVVVMDIRDQIMDINPVARQLLPPQIQNPTGKHMSQVFDWWPKNSPDRQKSIDLEQDLELQVGDLKHYYHLQVTPIWNQRQSLTGRLAVLRDITGEKLMKEAVALASVKNEFLAKVGHELRNPLTGILGVTEMLEYGVYGPITEQQHSAVDLIIECTRNLSRLVDDLLQQTQMEAGHFRLEKKEFAIDNIMASVKEGEKRAAEAKGLEFITLIAPDVPSRLYGDPLRLYQILSNLVQNAIKFTHQGYVRTRVFLPDEHHWAFEVSDTGAGVPTGMQERIFHPFQKLNNPVTGEQEGFGLGLSIVKQLVTLMGGEVTLSSVEGQGSVFTTTFPLEPIQERAG
jgi:signal transduction histidine kinase